MDIKLLVASRREKRNLANPEAVSVRGKRKLAEARLSTNLHQEELDLLSDKCALSITQSHNVSYS